MIANILTDRLIKSGIAQFIGTFSHIEENGKDTIFTCKFESKNDIKFSVDNKGNVYFIPFEKFKLLLNDNINLNKLMVRGMDSIHNKSKPDQYYMALFKFFVNIVKYIDNNDEGYSVPYIQRTYIKNDMRKFMEKLDGYYKTKEYKEIINKGNIRYVF